MNYKKHYDLLITSRQLLQENRFQLYKDRRYRKIKTKDNYFEKHHIIPKSLGGSDEKENLILLTVREHYIAHWLLSKKYVESDEMLVAFWMMSNTKSDKNFRSSRKYLFLKTQYINNGHHRSGKDHHFFGKHRSETTKNKIRIANLGRKHTEESKQKVSLNRKGKYCGEEHRHYKAPPWKNPMTLKSKYAMLFWENLDNIYTIWLEYDKPGCTTLQKIAIANNILPIRSDNKNYINSSRNAIKMFILNGDPTKNEEWLRFKRDISSNQSRFN